MATSAYALRVVLEQNGLINIFSLVFSLLLLYHTHRGYIEILLFITCLSGFIADILLIYTDGPHELQIDDINKLRPMLFISVILWTFRELGLTLYTNKLIKIIDHGRYEKVYYFGYNFLFIVILVWRLFDACYRTYDKTSNIIFIGNYVYLGLLSLIDIWSSIYLVKVALRTLSVLNPNYDSYKIIREILRSGILRIVLINFIPFARLIVSITVVSVCDYQNDVSLIVYSLQSSMILMYLIDLSIIKIERNNIFKSEGDAF
ncbi:unnamed protein product [Cunninghamella blakesleeana]